MSVAPRVRRRWAELEGYRLLAAVAVVLFHIRQHMQVAAPRNPALQGLHAGDDYPYQAVRWFEVAMSNVDVAVDFFFVVSGFLLVLPYAKAMVDGLPAPSLRAFALGRLLRVVPLYWTLVLVVWCARNFGYPGDWRDLLEHLTFTQWLDSKRIFYTIGPAWTLADEMWFYVTVPVVAGAARWLARGRTGRGERAAAYLRVLGWLIAGSLTWTVLVLHVWHIRGDRFSFSFGVPARLDTFCLGGVVAVAVAWADGRRLPHGVALALRVGALAALVGFLSQRLTGGWVADYVHPVAALAFAVVVLAMATSRPGVAHRLCDNRYVLAGGALTYALYIGHEVLLDPLFGLGLLRFPFQDMVRDWVVGLPLAVVASWLLYNLLEQPFTKLRSTLDGRWRWREYYPELVEAEYAATHRPGSLYDHPYEHPVTPERPEPEIVPLPA